MVEGDRVVPDGELNELAEEDIESLKEALAQEKEKAERYLTNWQRTEADFRNYKAREEQGKKDLIDWANSTLICDILPVLDAFDRAFEGVNPKDEELSWITGFRQIQKMLFDVLSKHGLAEMNCVGEAFDPSFHEAVAQQKGAEGVVLDEFRKGYKLKDKLLRASQVVVGGGDESSTAEAAEQVEEDLTGETA